MVRIIRAIKYEDLVFSKIEKFIAPHEKFCSALFEKILLHDKDIYILFDEKISGVIYFSEGHSLMCCIPKWNKEIKKALSDFLKDKKVFCIHGEESDVVKLEKIIKGNYEKKESRNMFLMEYEGLVYINKKGLDVFVCTKNDAEKLMPLQAGFAEEEVLPQWRKINLPAERMKLDKAIKNNTVYALGSGDSIYAKANISSYSNEIVQVSGVYTSREYRCKGYASFLVNRIAMIAKKVGCTATLLVRQENLAAYSAYKKAGFVITGTYKIVYYQ